MRQFPENYIYTACTGRCGQHSLGDFISRYALNTLVEVEPPQLLYPNNAPFGNYLRNFQRKWVFTDEMLGRGKALQWYRDGDRDSLTRLSRARLDRVGRLCRKQKSQTYFEVSKFFIRTYYMATHEIKPDIGILILKRDPMNNAKSFVNRHKDFRLDNLLPHERNVILKMDGKHFSPYQLYLWQWCELELRTRQFISSRNISRFYELYNSDLNDPVKICDMLDFFSVEHQPFDEMPSLQPINTNIENGFNHTVLTAEDFMDFVEFLDMLPTTFRDQLSSLDEWHSKYKAAGF